jgi:tubulin-specific chaperone D
MRILRLTESDKIQSSALARKLRVKIMQKVASIEIPHSNQNEIEVPESLEEIIDFLLSSLSDKVFSPHEAIPDKKDTIVRYTAAKAVSRIVLSLPSSFSNEIIATLFHKMDDGLIKDEKEWDFSSVDENTWHGSLLCLADIAWHTALHQDNIPLIVTYSLNVLKPFDPS